MIQIRIHGRGGQGVVTAAELIAIAAFKDGQQTQAFPSFGVERTGAPVESFVRIDNQPINTREHIYEPDILIIQDASLLDAIDVSTGCSEKTKVIINTAKKANHLKIKLPKENIFAIDATTIALEIIGKNIVNTTILGTFSKITNLVSLASLKLAIKEKFSGKGKDIVNKNIKAIEQAYKVYEK